MKDMSRKKHSNKNPTDFKISQEINILYNYILFRYNLEQKRMYFENIAKSCIFEAKNHFKNFNEIEKHIKIFDQDQLIEIDRRITDEARIAAQKKSKGAVKHFDSYLVKTFKDMVKLFDEECTLVGELSSTDKKHHWILLDKFQIMRELTKSFNQSLKQRLIYVPTGRGKRNTWSFDKYQELLTTYDYLHDLIKEARKVYKTLAKSELKKVNRKKEKDNDLLDIIKTAYPQLPENIIEKFKHKSEKDCVLAMEAVNETLGLNLEQSSIQTALSKARRIKNRN